MKHRLFTLSLLLLAGFSFCGCATMAPSLFIPPSDAVVRTFSPPPPAIIRLPVEVSVPKLNFLSKDLYSWVDQKIHEIGENAQKPRGIVSIKSPLSGVPNLWDAMQDPIFIDKNIWLLIRPEALSSGVIEPDKKNPFTWKMVLEMTAHPILLFGEKPKIVKRILPPLSAYKSGPSGFHAVSNTSISFKEANRILADPKDGLVNYPIRGSGSYHLRVRGVRLYGSGGEVIAETKIQYNPLINLSGKPSQMTIYFRGVPHYDPQNELFYLKRLNFDVKTDDFIMQVASWIFKSDILNALRKKAHIPIGSELDQIRERMNVVLNCSVGDHSRLVTQVNSFRVLGAYVNHDGIQAQMSLDGTAQLRLFSH
jgi:hypothetical protein